MRYNGVLGAGGGGVGHFIQRRQTSQAFKRKREYYLSGKEREIQRERDKEREREGNLLQTMFYSTNERIYNLVELLLFFDI